MTENSPNRDSARPERSLGDRLKGVLGRSVFWSYERGTWQYDVIVAGILAFIFLTPRSFFQDRPTLQLTDLRHGQGLVEVEGENGGTFLVDARLVDSFAPQKPDEAIQTILQRRMSKPFRVKSIEVLRGGGNVVLGYRVAVEQ